MYVRLKVLISVTGNALSQRIPSIWLVPLQAIIMQNHIELCANKLGCSALPHTIGQCAIGPAEADGQG
jgi:hypothetical protein